MSCVCFQVGCSKVYTSTSDVMTHENFHKKNAQLINDGFQRFRATEDCGTVGCQFYGQKTTHFHCRWLSFHGTSFILYFCVVPVVMFNPFTITPMSLSNGCDILNC